MNDRFNDPLYYLHVKIKIHNSMKHLKCIVVYKSRLLGWDFYEDK